MKIRAVLLVLSCLLLVRCATFYHLMGEEEDNVLTAEEKEMLEKTAKSVDLDFGYNAELDLNYLFPANPGYAEFKGSEKELMRAIAGMETKTLISYSEKIYSIKKMTEYKIEKYREIGDWKNYTFVKKYLFPSLDHFSNLLEKQALKKDASYGNQIKKRKKIIDRRVLWIMRRREFDEKWKYDYNS